MYFLLSGEGPTDLGSRICEAEVCEAENFLAGPLALIVDQMAQDRFEYSPLEAQACGLVSKHSLVARVGDLKSVGKAVKLPGPKRAKETRYFFNNARALARIASDLRARWDGNAKVIAVLFRDSDGTASAGRELWTDKHQSMVDGFDQEGFQTGVPMLPKPKSEAWILCAVKYHYQACDKLEGRSGNDASPNSLKAELEATLGAPATRELLCELVRDGRIDHGRLDMPSFNTFRLRMAEVLS